MSRPGATSRDAGRRRGLVLIGVLLVIAMAALAGAAAIDAVGAEVSSLEGSLDRTQSRALAWSGVQGAMAELLAQRERLLDGEPPELTREWTLFTDGSGRRGVVRLVPWGDGEPAASEGGKLDLNTASAGMLAALGVFDEATAQRIVEARRGRRFATVEGLLAVEGITPAMLDGPADDGAAGAPAGAESASGEGRPLRELVTVFSFDPNVQAGLGEDGAPHRGRRRVNLNAEWSERLRRGIADRFGDAVADAVEATMKNGRRFEKRSDLVRALRELRVPPEDWAPALDALATSPDPYLCGLVDLSSAPASVLACVPGIDAAAAEQIVQTRARLGAARRADVAWPLVQGILSPDQFESAVDHLTTRSMQWRVRVEAGFAPASDSLAELDLGPDGAAAPLEDRTALEAVIDLSEARPRVAYLRDVTLGPVAAALAAASAAEIEPDVGPGAPEEPPVAEPAADPEDRPSFVDLDFGGWGSSFAEAPTERGAEGPPEALAGSNEDAEPTDSDPGAAGPEEGVDRRLGRWTAGQGNRP